MPVTSPTNVLKTEAWLGVIKTNYHGRGFSYHYYLNVDNRAAAVTKLLAIVTKLKYLISLGCEIFDAVVYQPDSDKDGFPAINGPISSLAEKIITPGDGEDPDTGWVPHNAKSCLHVAYDLEHWRSKEFWRVPPDVYITDDRWVGPTIDYVEPTTPAIALTPNPSVAEGKVDGTYVERLRDYWRYIIQNCGYEFRNHPTDENSLQISPIKYIYMRRPTNREMGRAFLVGQRR